MSFGMCGFKSPPGARIADLQGESANPPFGARAPKRSCCEPRFADLQGESANPPFLVGARKRSYVKPV